MIRAALCGPSGSGKTTLATWLADELGTMINPVGSRSVARAMGFESPYDVDKAGKRTAFQERLQAEKIAWELAHDSFVTDRTTLDELVYSGMHGTPTAAYERAALGHMARYTHVFYCPFDVFCDLGDDPKRNHSMDYQREFDAKLAERIVSLEVASVVGVWTLDVADLDKRKSFIRNVLGLPMAVRDTKQGRES